MAISNFLNPEGENEAIDGPAKSDNEVLEEVIHEYLHPEALSDDDDIDELPPPLPTLQQALEALNTLRNYAESREELNSNDINGLTRLYRGLEGIQYGRLKQTTLDHFYQRP